MATGSSRTRQLRGRESERILARYLQDFWPDAAANAASLSGDDIHHVGRLALEVKATAGVPLLAALRQVHARAQPGQIPVGIWRPNGMGEARVEEWVAFTRVGTFFNQIALEAGYFNGFPKP